MEIIWCEICSRKSDERMFLAHIPVAYVTCLTYVCLNLVLSLPVCVFAWDSMCVGMLSFGLMSFPCLIPSAWQQRRDREKNCFLSFHNSWDDLFDSQSHREWEAHLYKAKNSKISVEGREMDRRSIIWPEESVILCLQLPILFCLSSHSTDCNILFCGSSPSRLPFRPFSH